ncbi:MAG: enoyl-CoA hydratase/isomerase family protein, partial [Halobacteria archaeon]|nr:enoyl-CoA hydratase/isomerase family protein [Halobacteria archaeon]
MIEYQEQESDNVAWITIDRPESANSLTPEHMEEVVGYIEQAEESEDVKTAVITGSGGTFCAGGDLEYIREIDEGGADAFATNLVEMLGAVEGADVPVLAAIEGAV